MENTPTPSTIQLRCKSCGGTMSVDEGRSVLSCPFCGSKELLIESDSVAVERIRGQTQLHLERQRQEFTEATLAAQEQKKMAQKFKKSFLSKLLLILFFICSGVCYLNFRNQNTLLAIIALVQTLLFLASWLLGMQIVKSKPHLYLLPMIIGIALILLFTSISRGINASKKEAERNAPYTWPSTGLAQQLPLPESSTGKILDDTDNNFFLELHNVSQAAYSDYIKACKDKGFTIEPDSSSHSYEAYNNDGYYLSLYYISSSENLSIQLNAPKALSKFTWPKSELASLVPVPESTLGELIVDRADRFSVYVGNISLEQYKRYVDSCWDSGFSLHHSRSEKSFSAENELGYQIKVEYEGFSTIFISLSAPEETPSPAPTVTVSDSEQAELPDDNSTSSDPSLVTPEFKEFMDSYEEFMDSYIEFMKQYSENPTDTVYILKYAELLGKLQEYTEKLDAIDEASLSPADEAYYLLVLGRVEQKMIGVSLQFS